MATLADDYQGLTQLFLGECYKISSNNWVNLFWKWVHHVLKMDYSDRVLNTCLTIQQSIQYWENWSAMATILPDWFDHPEECVSYKEIHLN